MNKIVPEKSQVMNHVLFLDFDGPLFPDRYISYHAENIRPYPGTKMPDMVSYWKMDPLAVEMLNFLHGLHPFTTVVSSSWKKFVNKEQCQDLFATNGLNLTLAEDWCTVRLDSFNYRSCVRASEITEYVERHSIEHFVVLDDMQSGSSLSKGNHALDQHKIVLVDVDTGIGSADYQRLLFHVKVWAQIPMIAPQPGWYSSWVRKGP